MSTMLDTMTRCDGSVRICWLGNAGWLLGHEGHLIAIDLDLFLPERSLPPLDGLDLLAERLDYLFITHAHTDHFNPDTVQRLMDSGNCTLVLPESCRAAAESYGLPENRILWAKVAEPPVDLQNNPLPITFAHAAVDGLPSWLRAETLPALHGHLENAVYAGASLQDCGYILTIVGKRIVQPGDSVLLQQHLQLADIDALFISPTEHNMWIDPACRLVKAVQPKQIFAQHFGSYKETPENRFWTHGYIQELGVALPENLKDRYCVPEYEVPYVIA